MLLFVIFLISIGLSVFQVASTETILPSAFSALLALLNRQKKTNPPEDKQ
jgi:lipopolysaccharide export LptBFGC system permease protein LptF